MDCDESISKLYFFDWQLLDNKLKEIAWKIAKFENDEKHTDNKNKEFELIISIKQVQKQLKLQQQNIVVKYILRLKKCTIVTAIAMTIVLF